MRKSDSGGLKQLLYLHRSNAMSTAQPLRAVLASSSKRSMLYDRLTDSPTYDMLPTRWAYARGAMPPVRTYLLWADLRQLPLPAVFTLTQERRQRHCGLLQVRFACVNLAC